MVAAAAAMLAPVAAAAQTTASAFAAPPVGDNDDEPLRAGPGVPGVGGFPGNGLSLGASLSSRYESNLGRLSASDAGYRLRPQANASYGLSLGQQGIFVSATAARDMFFDIALPLPNRDRLQLGGGFQYSLSRCAGTAGAGWSRSLALQSDATAFGGFQQERTTLGLTASCRISGALSVQGSVVRTNAEVERGLSQAFNTQSLAYSVGLGFGNATLGQLSLNASQTDSDFPGRLVLTPDGFQEDGLRQRSVRLGYQRAFGRRIALTLGVSYIQTTPSTDSQVVLIDNALQLVTRDSFSGLGYDVALDLNITPRLSVDFTFNRNSFANPFVGAQFTIANNYAAGISYALTPRYNLRLGASRRTNRYRGGFVSDLDPVLRISDEFDRFSAQLNTRLGRRLQIALDVTHNRRRANPRILDFSSTGVGLNLSFQLGRR